MKMTVTTLDVTNDDELNAQEMIFRCRCRRRPTPPPNVCQGSPLAMIAWCPLPPTCVTYVQVEMLIEEDALRRTMPQEGRDRVMVVGDGVPWWLCHGDGHHHRGCHAHGD